MMYEVQNAMCIQFFNNFPLFAWILRRFRHHAMKFFTNLHPNIIVIRRPNLMHFFFQKWMHFVADFSNTFLFCSSGGFNASQTWIKSYAFTKSTRLYEFFNFQFAFVRGGGEVFLCVLLCKFLCWLKSLVWLLVHALNRMSMFMHSSNAKMHFFIKRNRFNQLSCVLFHYFFPCFSWKSEKSH